MFQHKRVTWILTKLEQKQAGVELCQAQEKLGLARNCGHLLLIKKIEAVFHLPNNLGCLLFTLKSRSSSIYLNIEVVFYLP